MSWRLRQCAMLGVKMVEERGWGVSWENHMVSCGVRMTRGGTSV